MRNQIPLNNFHSSFDPEYQEFSAKMLTYKPTSKIGYAPYQEVEPESDGIIRKVKSKFAGLFKGATHACKNFFSEKDEKENIVVGEGSPLRMQVSIKDIHGFHFNKNPFPDTDFASLSNLLQNNNTQDNMNKLNVDKLGVNMANVSFGGSNSTRMTGNNDILNQSAFSFQSGSNSNSKELSL